MTTTRAKKPLKGAALLSIAETAHVAGVTYWEAHRIIKSGDIPSARVGRSWVVERGAAEAYRDAHSAPVEGEVPAAPKACVCADLSEQLKALEKVVEHLDEGIWRLVTELG